MTDTAASFRTNTELTELFVDLGEVSGGQDFNGTLCVSLHSPNGLCFDSLLCQLTAQSDVLGQQHNWGRGDLLVICTLYGASHSSTTVRGAYCRTLEQAGVQITEQQ